MAPITPVTVAHFPTLIIGPWCPFTLQASPFWHEVANRCGIALREVGVESDEGPSIIQAAGVAGVPCIIAAPGRHYYGYQVSPSKAAAFLLGDAAPLPSGT
jgi:hypothetical protein